MKILGWIVALVAVGIVSVAIWLGIQLLRDEYDSE